LRKATIYTKGLLTCVLLLVVLCGCRTFETDLVIHDELFTYDMPYDVTYLRVLDAIDRNNDWVVDQTDKANGKIRVRPENYRRNDNATLLVGRLERRKTSVELAPQSQQIRGIEGLLKDIDKYCMD